MADCGPIVTATLSFKKLWSESVSFRREGLDCSDFRRANADGGCWWGGEVAGVSESGVLSEFGSSLGRIVSGFSSMLVLLLFVFSYILY